RAERREPPEPEAPRGADVEQAPRREAGARDREGRCRRRAAVELLEVPRVPEIREDNAADLHRIDDRELELQVLDVPQVAADVGPVGDRRGVRVERLGERQASADAAQREAAEVEDAAEEVAGEDRHAAWF